MTTRSPEAPPGGTPAVPGRTIIASGATLNIEQASGCLPDLCGGAQLKDARVLENRGTTNLKGFAYVAADYGTTFLNTGTYLFLNDLGYYQGVALTATRSNFINAGTVQKAFSGETSVIDANFVDYGGSVVISSGTLTILSDASETASVSANATFGIGSCAPGALFCEEPTASPEDEQIQSLTVPSNAGTTFVTLDEGVPESYNYPIQTEVGEPLEVVTSGPTPPNPYTLEIVIDATEAGSGDLGVARNGSELFPCGQTSEPACLKSVTVLGDGDVQLTVLTFANSTYQILRPRLHN